MDYLTDTTMMCLTAGLLLGGLALGRRVGPVAACWAAGGAWIALRFADRMWRPVFTDLRVGDAGLDTEFWLPMSYVLLFAGMLAAVIALIAWVRPLPKEFPLPGRTTAVLACAAGCVAGAVILLAVVQSQVMSASAEERMPQALEWARPVLEAIGQEHFALPKAPAGQATAGR